MERPQNRFRDSLVVRMRHSGRISLWRTLTTIAIATAAVLNVACINLHGAVYVSFTEPIGGLRGSAKEYSLAPSAENAARNVEALADYRRFETSFYHSPHNPDGRPQHCLALSGGGVRAATYSIGVLQGLAEKNKLWSLDIISGVSGGAYALSWYYLQQWNEPPGKERPGGFPGYGKERVLANSGAWAPVLFQTFNPLAVLWRAIGGSLKTMGNAVSRFADGTTTHGTPTFYRVYGNTLAKIYHDSPLQEKNPTLYEMANFIRQRNLPFFVINTAVQRLGMYRDENASLWAGVFEMTPQWLGSPALHHQHLPYRASETISTVKDAITVSAAAIDAESAKGVGQSFLDFMGYSLGRKITWDINLSGPVVRLEPGGIYDGQGTIFLVAPKDYKVFERADGHPVNYLYLTDGGHVENLATYALVRRLCQDITIVDAEYDNEYKFGSYVSLKRHLFQEMNVNFEVPDIDNMLDGIMDYVTANKVLSNAPERKKPFDSSKPIMKGTIGPFAWGGNEADTHYMWLDVTYVKMSIDERILCNVAKDEEQNAVARYGEHLVRFYQRNRKWLQEDSDVACQTPFPQYSTTNQFYGADRMEAYMDLGYRTIINDPPH